MILEIPVRPFFMPKRTTQSTQNGPLPDILLHRILYNQGYSPLAGLPDHVLVNIMRFSNLESIARLRHTSRIFMILFSVDPAFKSLHLTSKEHRRFYDTARLWEVPHSIIPTHREAFFLQYQPLCGSCLERRKGDPLGRTLLSSMPVLYCSGCRTSHREMHFSARMRKAMDDDRLCIGHEGRLNVCNHISISLQQAKVDAVSGAKSVSCPFGHEKSRSCGSNTCPVDTRLQVHAYYDEHRRLRIMLSYASHIQVKRLQNGKICSLSLRKEFARAFPHEDIGSWYHMLTNSNCDEMRAFDPNLCDCVDYHQELARVPLLLRQRPIRVCPAPAIARWQEKAPEGGYVSETGRCAYMRHGFTFDGVGIQMHVDVLKCNDARREMLAIRKTLNCAIDLEAASSSGWGDLVYYTSLQMLTARESQILFFCPQQRCAVWRLQTFDLHLRAVEAKQMQRENLLALRRRRPKKCRIARMGTISRGDYESSSNYWKEAQSSHGTECFRWSAGSAISSDHEHGGPIPRILEIETDCLV